VQDEEDGHKGTNSRLGRLCDRLDSFERKATWIIAVPTEWSGIATTVVYVTMFIGNN